ncbi:LytR/AlgR family response regulator transcription factor [Psychroserpens luteolus]|uniref:LytR/AlgR family response regulator transcription factor n=1 Tax=Psychroserpens luteolus TaxID=2855840 RepID=UPI001E3A0375|nr:LytTR family DNA-binding domain-containing protein [Psychroserpens luteolus]MCD2258429.1 LytTR family DNA-binding domain-containing protein [Psychroserpens luteolus]
MQQLKCIIIDDEPAAVRLLERYVLDVAFLKLQKTFTKPLEALAFLESTTIDLVFLDVQMPQITGIQLSKIIASHTQIIFTTAYSEFALDSYEVATADYLLKPFSFERFYKAVLKAQKQYAKPFKTEENEDAFIFIKTDGKHNFNRVFIEEILFIEGLKNYVSVQLKNEQIITYSTLKHLSERLPNAQFIQIHKSYIIALSHINKIDNDTVWIQEKQLPIGNTYRKKFFDAINKRQL